MKASAPGVEHPAPWKWIHELEHKVAARWAAAAKSLDAFAGICRECLAGVAVEADHEAFLHRLLHLDYPRQGYPLDEFGDAAITVARNADFRIDVYVWNGGRDTTIHDHHFTGAFRPIFGVSRQHRFVFEPGSDCGPGLTEGVLRHRETLSVSCDDAVEIPIGERLIHLVEHLGEPTVTVCVRTDNLRGRHLNGYWFPGYRCIDDPLQRRQTRKRLNLLFTMRASRPADWTALIHPLLQSLPVSDLFWLVVEGGGIVNPSKKLDQAHDEFVRALRTFVRRRPGWLMVPPVHHRRIEQFLSQPQPAP